MKVKKAKERIERIDSLMNDISETFTPKMSGYDLMIDVVNYLSIYKETLEKAIDEAELNI